MTDNVYEETVRNMLNREADLFDRRSVAFCTIQGILLTAMAFAWHNKIPIQFALIIGAVGIISSIIFISMIINALKACFRLEKWWDANKELDYKGPGVIGLQTSDWRFSKNTWPHFVLMAFFILSWAGVMGLYIISHESKQNRVTFGIQINCS